jgi:integrase
MTQGIAKPIARRRKGNKYLPFAKYAELVDELDRLVSDGKWTQQRDALAVVLGLHGLRVSEVCRLTIDDLHVDDRTIYVATLKGGVDRNVCLGRGVCEAIVRWRAGSNAMPLLFNVLGLPLTANALRLAFKAVWREVSPSEYEYGKESSHCFHALRHTFAMRTLHNTGNPTVVAGRLGHRNTKTTDEYMRAYGQLSNERIKEIGNDIPEVPALAGGSVGKLKLYAG